MGQTVNLVSPQMMPAMLNPETSTAMGGAQMMPGAGAVGLLMQAQVVQGPDGGEFAKMSVEQLLLYCQAQLQSIDDDLAIRMANQEKMINRKQVLNEAKSAMDGFEEPTVENAADVAEKMMAAAKKLPPGDPARTKIEKEAKKLLESAQEAAEEAQREMQEKEASSGLFDIFVATASAATGFFGTGAILIAGKHLLADDAPKEIREAKVDKVTWEQTKDELQSSLDHLKDQAEMRMMRLQSLVGKRQTMVQLVSNMISKFDQQVQMVASNIKS